MSKLTQDAVRSSLLVGNFGASSTLPPPGDPIATMAMVLEVDRIKPYDGNVRLVPNPKYDELHLAISTQGPEAAGVLPITRRPCDELFMIARGGNTRLQIIQALAKSGDARFRTLQCLFHPWPGEAKVLADHIAENENRGETTFIEKALALKALRQRMEEEAGEPISLREFERRLADPAFKFGIKVSKSQLSRCQYAADFLYPLLPEALKSGLGPFQIEKLQRLEALAAEYWRRRSGDSEGEEAFRSLYAMVLIEHDAPSFSLEMVRQTLEVRLAELLGRPLHDVQAGIAGLEAGIEIGHDTAPLDVSAIAQRPVAGFREGVSQAGTVAGRGADLPRPGTPHHAPLPQPQQGMQPSPVASAEPTGPTGGSSHVSTEESVSGWRHDSYQLARELAERHGLEACVTEASYGLGFFVDLPRHSIAETPAASALWWWLAGLSEQLVYIKDGVNHVAAMPDESELKERVLGNRWDEIYERVGRHSSWMTLPHLLDLSEQETEACVQLFRGLRRLRQQAAEPELWKKR